MITLLIRDRKWKYRGLHLCISITSSKKKSSTTNRAFPTRKLFRFICFRWVLTRDIWLIETISSCKLFHSLIIRTTKKCFLQLLTRASGYSGTNNQGADPELVSKGGAHVERLPLPSPPLPIPPSLPPSLPSLPVPPLPSLSFPSLLPFPFPSVSSLPSPSLPSPWRGGTGVLPRKILKF